jgi:hypothetical protein
VAWCYWVVRCTMTKADVKGWSKENSGIRHTAKVPHTQQDELQLYEQIVLVKALSLYHKRNLARGSYWGFLLLLVICLFQSYWTSLLQAGSLPLEPCSLVLWYWFLPQISSNNHFYQPKVKNATIYWNETTFLCFKVTFEWKAFKVFIEY